MSVIEYRKWKWKHESMEKGTFFFREYVIPFSNKYIHTHTHTHTDTHTDTHTYRHT